MITVENTDAETRYNIIRVLRAHGRMTAGALYALGHADLASRADEAFRSRDVLRERWNTINQAELVACNGEFFTPVITPELEALSAECNAAQDAYYAHMATRVEPLIAKIDAIADSLDGRDVDAYRASISPF